MSKPQYNAGVAPFDLSLADPRHPFHLEHMAMALDEGEIDEEEYDHAEAMLLARLASPAADRHREVSDG